MNRTRVCNNAAICLRNEIDLQKCNNSKSCEGGFLKVLIVINSLLCINDWCFHQIYSVCRILQFMFAEYCIFMLYHLHDI